MPDYSPLEDVLRRALEQFTSGKGRERHAQDKDFRKQPVQAIPELLGDPQEYGLIYQAVKKLQEAQRLDHARRTHERLGAIIYIAAAIVRDEDQIPSAETVPVHAPLGGVDWGNPGVLGPIGPQDLPPLGRKG